MANSSADYSVLELQLGQALVEAVAPEEMEFFDAIAAAPKPSGKKRDHALGFGVPTGEDLGSISAALLVLCKPLLTFLWENAKDASGLLIKDLSEQARLALEKHLGEWFVRRFKKPDPLQFRRIRSTNSLLNSGTMPPHLTWTRLHSHV
ncbi:hypothetical protein IVB18_11700 [Bradyrhizobium sp. 186]|uniref:hypothetical protein n=1 Tax=Bradyrhizobium sp. 186 TaxID=2782654 RepID=UPI002000D227|nr:hypothetical protein [Bradyrhizobium sp. 186]UPK37901.1 hypothetical protein IVB18_11700 [Bradyrhizobium sp. 186]